MSTTHTPGPWRWEFNRKFRNVHLVGGRPQFDLTVMDFVRWGMGGAVPRFRDPAHDGLQLMFRLCDRPDWLARAPGREHHADWHLLATHPDARLMEAAPDLLRELRSLVKQVQSCDGTAQIDIEPARAAIAKATGEQQ